MDLVVLAALAGLVVVLLLAGAARLAGALAFFSCTWGAVVLGATGGVVTGEGALGGGLCERHRISIKAKAH